MMESQHIPSCRHNWSMAACSARLLLACPVCGRLYHKQSQLLCSHPMHGKAVVQPMRAADPDVQGQKTVEMRSVQQLLGAADKLGQAETAMRLLCSVPPTAAASLLAFSQPDGLQVRSLSGCSVLQLAHEMCDTSCSTASHCHANLRQTVMQTSDLIGWHDCLVPAAQSPEDSPDGAAHQCSMVQQGPTRLVP